MKKSMLIFLISVLSVFAFAEDLKGTWDIEFGMSKEQVSAIMKQKNMQIDKEKVDELSFKPNDNSVTYAGCFVDESVSFEFYDNKCCVIFLPVKGTIESVIKLNYFLEKKYNLEKTSFNKYENFSITEYLAPNGNTLRIFDYSIPISPTARAYYYNLTFTDVETKKQMMEKKFDEAYKETYNDL